MDKVMKRVIGYVKPKAQTEEKKVVLSGTIKFNNGVLKTDDKKLINRLENHPKNADLPCRLEKSKMISEWITTHPEFKWGSMCLKLGIDKANFQRSFKADPPNIKEEYISKIENFLKNYGYGN